jgi:pyruvate kinase
VAITRGGSTARLLASLRPAAPILAATDSPEVARRLSLHWGVRPVIASFGEGVSSTVEGTGRALRDARLVAPGATVVVVSISADLTQRYANFLKLHQA